MKTLNVVAAIIRDKDRILATQRGYGEFAGKWEFPGGKVEAGEGPEEALAREIEEELGCVVQVGQLAGEIEYDYPDFHLSMACYWCEVVKGKIEFKEAAEGRWLTKDTLLDVEWLPADIQLVEKLTTQI